MRFISELSDEQLSEVVLESDQLYVKRSFGALPELTREAVDQPEVFWKRQEAAIKARICASQKSSRRFSLIWASALAMALVGALFMRDAARSVPARPQPDRDQELLISVERAVGSDLPGSLEPATLLSNEIIASNIPAGSRGSTKIRHKENTNEKE